MTIVLGLSHGWATVLKPPDESWSWERLQSLEASVLQQVVWWLWSPGCLMVIALRSSVDDYPHNDDGIWRG